MLRLLASLLLFVGCTAPKPGADAEPDRAAPATSDDPDAARQVAREEVAPGLAVVVHAHVLKVGTRVMPAWTFVTEGLVTRPEAELVLTVLRAPGQAAADFPREPLAVLGGIANARGRIQLRPGMTVTGGDAALPGTDLRAVYFTRGSALGLPLPERTLTAVLMTHDEHTLGNELGYVRWAGRVGRDASTFPTPWWVDPARTPVLAQEELAGSLLAKVRRRYLIGTSLVYRQKTTPPRLTITIEPVAVAEFQAMVRETGPFALLADLAGDADAQLVWRPGEENPAAISDVDGRGERIGGNFVMFVTEAGGADEFRMIEDGFGLILEPATWQRFAAAVAATTPLELPLKDMVLALEWPTTTHVDGAGVRHEVGDVMRLYEPEGVRPAPDPTLPQVSIVLLTPQTVLPARITVEALAGYLKQLEAAVHEHERTAAGSRPAHNLVVDVELKPAGPPTISTRSDHAAELAEHMPLLAARLRRIAGPKVGDSVHFLMEFVVPAAR